MKNIEKKHVEALKELANNYKEYKSLYDHAVKMAASCEHKDIVSIIQDHIEKTLNDIAHYLSELYDDWCGVTAASNEFYKTHSYENTEFWSIADKIHAEHEGEGMCQDISGIVDELYVSIRYIPISFMRQFISAYGIFMMDRCDDVWIV